MNLGFVQISPFMIQILAGLLANSSFPPPKGITQLDRLDFNFQVCAILSMFIPTSLGEFPLHLKSSDADLQKGHLFEIRILGSLLNIPGGNVPGFF